jgi:two-component system NarL family sensor kinase
LDRIGLAPALQAVAEYQAEQSGVLISVEIEARLPTRHDRLLFSTARELLINAIRHARARHIEIRAGRDGPNIRLAVTDDGVGWELCDLALLIAEGHFGLASVSDRLESVGGRLRVHKDAARPGTRAIALIPAGTPAPGDDGYSAVPERSRVR